MEIMKDIDNFLEQGEVHKMLNVIDTNNFRDYLIINLLWRTGMRVSELIKLEYNSLDFDNGFINVKWSKRDKSRRIPIDNDTLRSLKQYSNQNKITERLFPLTRQRAFQILKRHSNEAGFNNVHPHTMRHSFSVNCVRQGVDIITLQKWLGHSDPKTTAIYLQFRDKDMKEIYEQVKF